jgi:RNA polymerase sigma-70 factor (ECF subfamily)
MTPDPRGRRELTTHASLLARLRDPRDHDAWSRFLAQYGPLIDGYARRRGLTRSEAEEVRDACLEVLARKIPDFDYDPARGGFKAWLYRIASFKVVDALRLRRRRGETLDEACVVDPSPGIDAAWEDEWRREHLRAGLEEVRKRVPVRVWQVFALIAHEGCTIDDVCLRLQLAPGQVYRARAQVLAHLRAYLAGFDAE